MTPEADLDAHPKLRLSAVVSLLASLLALVLVVGLFTCLTFAKGIQGYCSFRNFQLVATQTAIVGTAALGMTLIIISGGIDLSVGSVIALTSVVTAYCLQCGWPAVAAVLAGIAAGGACGFLNGAMITGFRIVSFIATLGMLGIARGLAKYIAGEQKIDAPAGWLSEYVLTRTPTPPWLLFSPGVWLMFALGLVMAVMLHHTLLGRNAFAIGSNESATRLCGVNIKRMKVYIFTIGGLFAGLAGVMQFCRLTVGDPTTAIGTELDVIAAVVIGGGSLNGGAGSILGSLVGAFVMSFLRNGCSWMGVPNYVQEIVIGAIIVLAVAFDQARQRRRDH